MILKNKFIKSKKNLISQFLICKRNNLLIILRICKHRKTVSEISIVRLAYKIIVLKEE